MNRSTLIMVFFCLLAIPVSSKSTEPPPDLFVIVTTGDPVTQLMSMVLATQAMNKAADVDILLCGEAGALAVKGSQEILLQPNKKSPQMLLKNLINSGVSAEICPPYLPNTEKSAADLITGVAIAKPAEVADKLLHEKTKILSY